MDGLTMEDCEDNEWADALSWPGCSAATPGGERFSFGVPAKS